MILLLLFVGILFAIVALLGIVYLALPNRLPFNPKGRHALVTGGSKGIGKCIAAELLRSGCRVVSIVARDEAGLTKAREELLKLCADGQIVRTYSFDLSKGAEEIQKLISTVENDSGPVDLLVNNAGTVLHAGINELPANAFEQQMQTNFFSAANLTRAVLPGMKERGEGHIAFVSSAAGQCAIWGYSAYSPSKFALRALADVLHMELLPFGIGVSVLFPPNTDTEGFKEELRTMPDEVREISNSAGIFPPEEVAAALVQSIRAGEFWTCVGLEGKMLGLLTAGSSPEPNPLKAFAQILLAGPIRAVMLIYGGQFNAMIKKCHHAKRARENGEKKAT